MDISEDDNWDDLIADRGGALVEESFSLILQFSTASAVQKDQKMHELADKMAELFMVVSDDLIIARPDVANREQVARAYQDAGHANMAAFFRM
jgi:hypothetical protein